MKGACVLTCWLLVTYPSCLFGSVAVNSPSKPSARNIQITALVDGKPSKGVKVETCRYEKNVEEGSCFSLMTDAAGRVMPPTLSLGEYGIVASTELNLVGNVSLRVSSRAKEKVTVLSIDLVASHFPTWQQQLAAADQMSVKEKLQQFSGIVHDPSGSEIVDALIEVVRKGSGGKDLVARLKTAQNGRFSARLPQEEYLAIFREPGFSTQIVPVEVAEQGAEHLQVTLQIAPSAQ